MRAIRPISVAAVVLLGVPLFFSPLGRAADFTPFRSAEPTLDEIRSRARELEKQQKYSDAVQYYAYLLARDRNNPMDRADLQRCLRHQYRVKRHQDTSYRKQVLLLEVTDALRVYGEVLEQLHNQYLEPKKADLGRLYRQGIQELRLALNDESFCRQYLPSASRSDISNFLQKLSSRWHGKPIEKVEDAQNQALSVALHAAKLGLPPTVTVLEFACGACNALDEHTFYMTPQELGEDLSSLRGQNVGIGIELAATADKNVVVSQVVINSPAYRAGLHGNEQVLSIDRIPIAKLSVDAANEKLRGKVGTAVELAVVTSDKQIRTLSLVRTPINASVAFFQMTPEAGIGYLSLTAFNDKTMQELDEAIRQLEMQGMKALILDLRGNGGGLFDAAVQVAERFLWEGAYIVSTRGKVDEVKRVSRNTNPSAIPLVLLVDGTTASAAEIVAGALKENFTDDMQMQPRATVVGMPTFGKGTTQHMVELKTVRAVRVGGIRITWARIFSPQKNPYNGVGVEPHVKIDGPEAQFTEALQIAQQLLRRQMAGMMN
jgi:carboxyl-terminal processing protease